MKNLYPKGKVKIHPSPAVPPPPSSACGSSSTPPADDALAVLKLLPAAILVLAAAMSYEDKEVLAYLITRSIHDHAASATPTAGVERKRSRGPAAHRTTFDCGCFDCYTSFWSRWDCSPDREVIHQAIEAFEEHLASSEKKGVRGRRKDRRAVGKAEKGKEKRTEEQRSLADPEAPAPPAELERKSLEELAAREATEASGTADAAAEKEAPCGGGEEAEAAAGGERRKGWSDVMGFVNSRFWSLWGPGV